MGSTITPDHLSWSNFQIFLGGSQILVSQKLLHHPKRGVSLQKMGGEGMSQSVGGDVVEPQLLGDSRHHSMHGTHGDTHRPPAAGENRSLGRKTIFQGAFPGFKSLPGGDAQGNVPLLLPLTEHPNPALFKIQSIPVEIHQLRYSKAASVEQLKNGPISTLPVPLGALLQKTTGILPRKSHRKMFGELGGSH
jgi:hypothetical protein